MSNEIHTVNKDRISRDAACSLSHFVGQLRPPFDREKDEDPFKVERYKIAARIAASYATQAWIELEFHPAYQAITESEPSEEIDEYFNVKTNVFYVSLHETLNKAMENELKRRNNLPLDTQERRELERFKSLLQLATDDQDPLSKIKAFFTLGNGTGVTAIANLIETTPLVYFNQFGQKISKSELLQIARNSYHMIDQFTQLHLDDFSKLEYGLIAENNKKAKRNDPKHFLIEGVALKVREESLRSIFQPTDHYSPLPAHTSARTGCPTRSVRVYNGERDQILAKDFFDRFLNVVEKL